MKRNGLNLITVALALLIILAACTGNKEQAKDEQAKTAEKEEVFDPEPDPNAKQVSSYNEQRINDQEQIDEALLSAYVEGTYSFEKPFIKVDPYDAAPLTALTMFETDEPVQITVTVGGKESQQPIEKTWEAYEVHHEIPILGLYPATENKVTLEATNEVGETDTTELSISTEPLPDDFLTTDLVEADTKKMEDGLTFITPSTRYAYAVDDNAEVRWYSTLWNSHIFNRLENGNLLYITKEADQDKYNELLEMDMLGKVSNSYLIQLGGYEDTNVVHHDVIELPNGHLLATTHDVDSDYIEDEMTEIDRETGETRRNFNFRDILPEEFYLDYDGDTKNEADWLHQNAIWFDETDNSILISSRHQDLIMKLSYPAGKINWILAAPEKWPEEYERYVLDAKNEAVKFPAGPHAVKTLPDQDNNENTADILLFDNNKVISRGDEDESEKYSRAVQYRINEKKRTVEEVWSYGEERGKPFFSGIVGNTQYLADSSNRLITSGYTKVENEPDARRSKIVEVSDQDPAEVVYEIVVSGFEKGSHRQVYRANRLPLYPEKEWESGLGKGK